MIIVRNFWASNCADYLHKRLSTNNHGFAIAVQTNRILALEETYSEATLSLLCTEFYHRSPLHRAVGISQSEFCQYMTEEWEQYSTDGPVNSLIAIDEQTNVVLGCMITAPFPQCFEQLERLPDKRQAIAGLLQALQQQYLESNDLPSRALMVDIAVVRSDAGNRGIYQSLRSTLHQQAANKGFNMIFGELSSAVTQKVCVEKFGHQVVGEISYHDYRYNNRYPFAGIKDPPTIQLVAGRPGR